MPIFWGGSAEKADEDMAGKSRIDAALVDEWRVALTAAGDDRKAFDAVLDGIKGDCRLRAGEVIAIAHAYQGGGNKPGTRAAAIAAIGRSFVDRLRSAAKNRAAEKVRLV
jgi:hypothetical protein